MGVFASFCDDFAGKNVDFSMQNAKSKYQTPNIFGLRRAGFLIRLPLYPPLVPKIGKNKGGKTVRGGG